MKKNRVFRTVLLVVLLVCMMAPAIASATIAYVNTNSGNLNLRAQPTTGSAVIAKFPKGTQVNIMSTSGAWCYVSVGGYNGYMNNSYLTTYYPGTVAPAVNPSPVYPTPYITYTNDGVNYYPVYFEKWEDLKAFLDTVHPSWPYPYSPYYPYYPCWPVY